ncbi:MAG: hypothetical protein QOF20_3406 [Acidimicrobiaceae bacterium]|jgi:hypothetical protein|nr:hypothetical protein [Acidimicrobiaceae bacterium]MDQ1366286.1 hypothetical protein [Acidimicrobiaceae bacterium]MDQ1371053.1 hypothetical protein [Acidimicrobiaceae bacterium]MDQ1376243.1 hypothetical protein [Acidimicrobiaceae bacterium]MDQ1420498.1 hypothetical protein [Acidimicrobiaceae bacterium]
MDELPEETIDDAEGVNTTHSHDGISSADASLVEHLRSCHELDTEPELSASTQEGLHDRLHSSTKAIDD